MLSVPLIVKRKKQSYIALRSRVDRSKFMRQAEIFFAEVDQYIRKNGAGDVGPALFRFHQVYENGEADIEFGFILSKQIHLSAPYRLGIIPQGQYALAQWRGEKSQICDIHDLFVGWIKQTGAQADWELTKDGLAPEAYLNIFPDFHLPDSDPRRWYCDVAMRLKGE